MMWLPQSQCRNHNKYGYIGWYQPQPITSVHRCSGSHCYNYHRTKQIANRFPGGTVFYYKDNLGFHTCCWAVAEVNTNRQMRPRMSLPWRSTPKDPLWLGRCLLTKSFLKLIKELDETMIKSLHGNTFYITDPLWWEPTYNQWIFYGKGQRCGVLYFPWYQLE